MNSAIIKTSFIVIIAIAMVLITSTILLAQPGLPSAPDQAPIDGGLGLLMAAGGAYAWKKLRKTAN